MPNDDYREKSISKKRKIDEFHVLFNAPVESDEERVFSRDFLFWQSLRFRTITLQLVSLE